MCVSGHSWTVLCQRLGHSRFFDLGVNINSINHYLSVLPVIHFISESVYVLYVFIYSQV